MKALKCDRCGKLIEEMKRYIAEHDDGEINWTNNNIKYCLVCVYDTRIPPRIAIIRDTSCFIKQLPIYGLYASNDKVLIDMVKELGEARVKKFYFDVED